jgi:transcriptional regulator with XRE-family HTH domain
MAEPPNLGELSLPNRHVARRIREASGWTRQAVAAALGVHPQTIVQWELGTSVPSGRHMWPYAELLAQLGQLPSREAAG